MDSMHPDDLQPHPQQHLVPAMRAEEFEEFVDDISLRDIKTPLEVHGCVILDGFHRWRAAKELGLTDVPTIEARLQEDESAIEYMLRSAVLRRHLTDDQRAMCAAMWARENPSRNGRPKKSEENGSPGRSRHIASTLFKVPVDKTRKATEVLGTDPYLAKKVHNGEVPLSKARSIVRKPRGEKNMTSAEVDAKINVPTKKPNVSAKKPVEMSFAKEIKLAVEAEREACARLLDELAAKATDAIAEALLSAAASIRIRA